MFGASKSGIPGDRTTDASCVLLENGPADTVQRLKFSGANNDREPPQFLAGCSWDGFVKVWELSTKRGGYGSTAKIEVQQRFQGE